MLGQRLLRAAMVVVARKRDPSKPATENTGANGEAKGGGASA
jgi:hypothetical protein